MAVPCISEVNEQECESSILSRINTDVILRDDNLNNRPRRKSNQPKKGPTKKHQQVDSGCQPISDAFEKGQSSTRKQSEKISRSFQNCTGKAMYMPFEIVWLALLVGTTMKMARSSFGMVSAYHARLCKGIRAVEEYIPGILKKLKIMSKPERCQWMEKVMAHMAACIAGKRPGKQGCCRKTKWKTTSNEGFKAMLNRRRREVLRNSQTTPDDERTIINKGYIQEQPEVQLMQPPTGKPSQPNYQDESQRVNSFQGCPELRHRAHDLASSGFYLTTYNFVKCSSCQQQRHMRELDEDSPRWHFPTCRFRNQSYSSPGTPHPPSFGAASLATCPRWDVSSGDSNAPTDDEELDGINSSGSTSMSSISSANSGEESSSDGEDACAQMMNDPPTIDLDWGEESSSDGEDARAQMMNDPPTINLDRGPENALIIQNRPGSRPDPAIHIGNEAAPPPPPRWRMANVVSADHRRFLSNLYLNRELDRLTSFARWPVSRPNVAPAALARTGFFYLGDMDRTQCFSCGGVLRNWTLEDDAQEEHRAHFPSCALVQGTENWNVVIPEEPELPENQKGHYPCRYPANPHMRSEAARLETFYHRWPAGRVEATAALIAQAGFFFLGERDRVKCWYCNGELQNWEYDHMPWIEHAKWFPNCQFLLQNRGQVFVYRHLAMNPHLARPIMAKQEGATVDVRQPSPPPIIIDPREEMRKKKEKIENIMKTSDVCKTVIAMGFSVNVVRRLLEERVDAGTEANQEDIYGSASALLDDVMKKEEEMQREAEEEEARKQAGLMSSMQSAYSTNLSSLAAAPGSGRYNVSFYDDDEPMDDDELYGSMNGPARISSVASASSVAAAKQVQQKEESQESLQEQLQKIKEEQICKICFSNTADMVFIPCSHMICCMDCTQAIRQCPVCRTKIEKAIKTYVN